MTGRDLLVLPAEQVTTLRAARVRYESVLAAGHRADPTPAIAELIRDVEAWSGLGSTTDGPAAVLHLPPGDDHELLTAVLRATARRELAVADLRTPTLYDPRERIDVTVKLGDDSVLPYLSRSLLAYLLPLPGEYPWLIVSRAPETYIQTRRLPDDSYEVEHRAGSADRHFQAYTANPSIVHRAIWSWLSDDPRWRDVVAWHRIEL